MTTTIPSLDSLLTIDESRLKRDLDNLRASLSLATITDAARLGATVNGWAASVVKRLLDASPSTNDQPDEAGLRALEDRCDELRDAAADADIEESRALSEARELAKATARAAITPAPSTSPAWRKALDWVNGVDEPVAPVSAVGMPEELWRMVKSGALARVRGELAAQLEARLRDRLRLGRQEVVRQGVRREARTLALQERLDAVERRIAAFPSRSMLPCDRELDTRELAKDLVRRRRFVPAAFVGSMDKAASVEDALQLAISREVADIAQRPRAALLADLSGGRWPDRVEAMLRDGSPWAALDPVELPGREHYAGLAIGVAEADDAALTRDLLEGLRRVGDVARQEVEAESDLQLVPLPPGVIGRAVRGFCILPVETAVGMIFDLMIAIGDPGAREEKAAARDWIDELEPLVSSARLQEEIDRRKRRGEDTHVLERWLPRARGAGGGERPGGEEAEPESWTEPEDADAAPKAAK